MDDLGWSTPQLPSQALPSWRRQRLMPFVESAPMPIVVVAQCTGSPGSYALALAGSTPRETRYVLPSAVVSTGLDSAIQAEVSASFGPGIVVPNAHVKT